MMKCICGCSLASHHPESGTKPNQGCFHHRDCTGFNPDGETIEPLPCAGTNRDDEPCSGEVYGQYSLGIYAGRWCNKHWKTSGYRDEPASAFDPADAGETYGDEDL